MTMKVLYSYNNIIDIISSIVSALLEGVYILIRGSLEEIHPTYKSEQEEGTVLDENPKC